MGPGMREMSDAGRVYSILIYDLTHVEIRAYLTEPFSVKTTFVHCLIQLGLGATIEKEPAGPRGG